MADEQDSKERRASGLPRWKKAVFGLLVAVLFFGLLELILALFGVKPLLYQDDPYFGFSSKVPLFVKSGDQMVTAENKTKWFNEQKFPRKKDRKTRRIFCLGGSTTYGRPFRDASSFCGWLREFLPAADPSRKWEVINAGGISYASYRVAALTEELVDYVPDLFVVYCGHNEFLERRTYGELMEMPEAVRGLQGTLAKSRAFSLISRMVKGGGGDGAEKAGELDTEVNTILDNSVGPESYTRDEEWKRGVLSHYRFNLARIVDIAQAAHAEVLFVMPASNLRNSSPFKSEHRAGLSAQELEAWTAHFAAARKAHQAGDKAAALAAIDAAVALDGLHAEAQYLRGRILDSLEKFAEAKTAYELALENDICPLRMLAEMRGILKEVADDRGVSVVDFNALIVGGAAHGIPGEAEFLDHVHPTIEAHRSLALALIDSLAEQGVAEISSDWNEAAIAAQTKKVMARITDYERGIALRNLANVLKWAGKYEDAYTAAKKSLELTPNDAYANFVTGDLAETLGKPEEAMKQYKHLTSFSLNPKEAPYFVEVHFKYAGLLMDKGEHAECVRMLRKAIQLKPGHQGATEALPFALKDWGVKALRAGKGEAAIAPLQQLSELTPRDANVRNLLGAAYIQARRPNDAIPQLEAVLEGNPNNPAVHNNLATAYAQMGDKEKALKHFSATVQLNPNHLGAITNMGELYFDAKEWDLAEASFRQVLALQPGHPAATARLAQINERRAPGLGPK